MHRLLAAAGAERAVRASLAALILAGTGAAPAAAQTLFQGRIDVTVQDAQDRAVPGATVEIAGPTAQQQVTDANGEAHFLNLAPGGYVVTVALQGFTTYRNDACVWPRPRSVPLRATLQVGGVTETVQVNVEARRRSGPPDRDHRCVVRRAAAAAVGARSVGGPADRSRRRRRSRQRRRSGVGAAVELPREGAGWPTTPGTSMAFR